MEVSERKSNPEVSSLKLQFYIESDLNELPCRSQVGTEKNTNTFKPTLPKKKKKTKKYQERKLMIKELTTLIYSSCELTEHYLNCIL